MSLAQAEAFGYWALSINNVLINPPGSASSYGCQRAAKTGDNILWAFYAPGTYQQTVGRYLQLVSTSRYPQTHTSGTFSFNVTDATTGAPVPGAIVKDPTGVYLGSATAAVDGTATLQFATAGLVNLKAYAAGYVRSNTQQVTVI